jgi:hypothetical protein
MKALMLTSLITLTSTAFATLPEAHIKNLNFAYNAPTGTGKVEEINIPSMEVAANLVDISANVDIAKNTATLNFGGANMEMNPIPDLLKDLQTADIVSLVLDVTSTELNMTGTRIFYKTSKEGMALENFRGKCLVNNSTLPSYKDKVLDYCTTDGDVYIGKFTQQSGQALTTIASALDKSTFGSGKMLEDASDIRSLNFDTKNHDMSGSVTIDGKTIRFWGGSWYLAETKTMKIKIDRAKWGLFNITDRMFGELKQKESAKFIVQRPFVYLILD